MKSVGRAAVPTFHSGVERLVKKAFKADCKAGVFSRISEDDTRSAKLRWAIRA